MIHVVREGRLVVISFTGDNIDSSNYKKFKGLVQPHIREGAKILFDISVLKFIDSSGLGALLSILRDLQKVGGEMKMCSPTPAVKILFELVRLQKIIDVLPNRAEAAAAFSR